MRIDEIETRKAEIRSILDSDQEFDVDALAEEVRQLDAEKAEIEERAAKEAELRNAVAPSVIAEIEETVQKEERKMENIEVRNSKEYIDAYAEYLKTGDDKQCRALLTENVSGSVAVPELVYDIVKTAWDREGIMALVKKSYIKGNLKVGFELSSTDAAVHTEGQTCPSEETLVLGTVSIVPASIKKWITISDEAVTMGGEEFLRYIYDELTYQIVKKLAALCVGDVTSANTSNQNTSVGVPKVNKAPSVTVIPEAAAYLSDEAENLCVVMNRLTEKEFIAAYAAGNFGVDPFAGLTKIYTSALPAYSTASTNAVYAIVGDLSAIQVNYPEGDAVAIKYDDLTKAEEDVVKIVGRQYAAHAITRPGRLVSLTKPAAATT